MNILILGVTEDKHIQSIIAALKKSKANFTFVDVDKDFSSISYFFESNTQQIKVDGIPLESFASFYWRFAPEDSLSSSNFTIDELCEKQEVWNFFMPLDNLSGLKCINSLLSNLKMENKIFQLSLAAQHGLVIPKTYIGSDIEIINDFAVAEGSCIEKNLGLSWENGQQAVTRKLNLENIKSNKTLPCIYQKKIQRNTELRVFVIGEEIVCVQICIDDKYQDIIDWREAARHVAPMYKLYKLSNLTTDKLLKYHKAANLVYAAYDFILDEYNQEIFLECNPNGNWMFLPLNISESISNLIAKELMTFSPVTIEEIDYA